MINLMKNTALWKEWGIVIEKGMGAEWFIFDKERGMALIDNIGIVTVKNGSVTICGEHDFYKNVPEAEKVDAVEEYLYFYFFG